jgi:hypothetical protein
VSAGCEKKLRGIKKEGPSLGSHPHDDCVEVERVVQRASARVVELAQFVKE